MKKKYIQRFLCYFAVTLIFLLLWQGLELLFYKSVTKRTMDNLLWILMLPGIVNISDAVYYHLQFHSKGIRIEPAGEYQQGFSKQRRYVFANKMAIYFAAFGLLQIAAQRFWREEMRLTEVIIIILFAIGIWMSTKYLAIKKSLLDAMIDEFEEKQNMNSAKDMKEEPEFLQNIAYMLYKDGDEYYLSRYDPKEKDLDFYGFQINCFKFEFVKLSKIHKEMILQYLDQTLEKRTIDLYDLTLNLKMNRIAYQFVFAPDPTISADENIHLYSEVFLPFYKDCIDNKLYKPVK